LAQRRMNHWQYYAKEDGGTGGFLESRHVSDRDGSVDRVPGTAQEDGKGTSKLSEVAVAAWEAFFEDLGHVALQMSPLASATCPASGHVFQDEAEPRQRVSAAIAAFVTSESLTAAGCALPASELLAWLAHEAIAVVRRVTKRMLQTLQQEQQRLIQELIDSQDTGVASSSGKTCPQAVLEQCLSSMRILLASYTMPHCDQPQSSERVVSKLSCPSQPLCSRQHSYPAIWLQEDDDAVATERQPTGELFSCRAAPGAMNHSLQRTTLEPDAPTLQQPVPPRGSCDDSFWSDGDVADERYLASALRDLPRSHSNESVHTSCSSQPTAPHATPQESKQGAEEDGKDATASTKASDAWDQHIVAEKLTAKNDELTKQREAKRRQQRHGVTHAAAFRLRSDAERWASVRIAEWRLARARRQRLVAATGAWRALCGNENPSDRNSSWL